MTAHPIQSTLPVLPARCSPDEATLDAHETATVTVRAVEIAADRCTATSSVACTVLVESPIDAPGCTLVDMARAQGEGFVRSTARRVLEQSFVRRKGVWELESSRLLEPV